MKTIYLSVLLIAMSIRSAAQGKPRTITEVLDRSISSAERMLLSVAEAMPENKYDFVPVNGEFQGVRSFAQMVKHVAVDQYLDAAALLKEKVPVDRGTNLNGPDSIRTKTEILKFLNDAFAYMHTAIRTVNRRNLMELVQFEDARLPKLMIVDAAISHPLDHYGQLVEYLRMNGIDPQGKQ